MVSYYSKSLEDVVSSTIAPFNPTIDQLWWKLPDNTLYIWNGTAWVISKSQAASDPTKAPINSPAFTGIPTTPTAPVGTNTGQIASTAFVRANTVVDAPSDNAVYGRKNKTWSPISAIVGPPGPAGVPGEDGPPGPSGPQGEPGDSFTTFEYMFQSQTTAPPTGNGVRFNNANYANVTEIYIANLSSIGRDNANAFSLVDKGNRIFVQDKDDGTRYAAFDIAARGTNMGNYTTFPVTWRESGIVPLPEQRMLVNIASPSTSFPEAPDDTQQYARQSKAWSVVVPNPTWSTLSGKPSTFPPTTPIPQSSISTLESDLASKVTKSGDTMSGALKLPAGSATAPSLTFTAEVTTGLAYTTGGILDLIAAGTRALAVGAAALSALVPVRAVDGSAAVPAIAFTAETNSGLYRQSTGNVSLAVVGNEMIRWTGASKTSTLFGPLITVAPTATIAGFRLPHGTAPTVPNNGDLWTQNDGVYARVNGVTVGPFGAAGGAGISDAPNDGSTYGRKNLGWTPLGAGGGISEAPTDGKVYARSNAAWNDLSDDFLLKADVTDPTFYGNPRAPTPIVGNNTTSIATTAFVATALAGFTGGGGGGGATATYIGDVPPSSPVVGQLWWESDTGNLFIYYDDLIGAPQWVPATALAGTPGSPGSSGGSPQWDAILNKPTTFAPSAHSHTQAEVTGLSTALAGKEPTIATGNPAYFLAGDKTWKAVSGGSGGGIPEAPTDGLLYSRRGSDASWQVSPSGSGGGGGIDLATGDARYVNVTGDTLTGPLALPSSGTAGANSLNFGTPGTGIFGGPTFISVSQGGSVRFAIESGYIYAHVPVMGYFSGDASNTNFNFGTLNTGLYGTSTMVGVSVGGILRLNIVAGGIYPTVPIVLSADPTLDMHAASKVYVDTASALRVLKTGDTMSGTLDFTGSGVGQTTAKIRYRNPGTNIEFGHSNASGYANTLGNYFTSGYGFLAFHAEAGSNANTFLTRGVKGSVMRSDLLGGFIWETVPVASANNQVPTNLMSLSPTGALTTTNTIVIVPAAGTAVLSLQRPAGVFYNRINSYVGGKLRWDMQFANTAAESTGNVGSDFALARYADDGTTQLTAAMTIARSTGIVDMPSGATTTTQTVGNNTTSVATTAFVKTAVDTGDALSVLKTGDTMTGNLKISKTYGSLEFNKPASGSSAIIWSSMGATGRWAIYLGDATAESGSNTGSDFDFQRYTDGGAASSVMKIPRSTGIIEMPFGATINGALNVGASGLITTAAVFGIVPNTADGADTSQVLICGGGGYSVTRGGFIACYGNEVPTYLGRIRLMPGTGAWTALEGGVASTSSITGAAVVTGGLGVSGAVFTGGAINAGGAIGATTSVTAANGQFIGSPALAYLGSSGAGTVALRPSGVASAVGEVSVTVSGFTVNGATNNFVDTTDTAGVGPIINFDRLRPVPAASDTIAGLYFRANNLTPAIKEYAAIYGYINDPTVGSEDGTLVMRVTVGGTAASRLTLNAAGVTVTGALALSPAAGISGVTTLAMTGALTGATSIAGSTTITAGTGLIATTGNVTATAGDIVCGGGDFSSTAAVATLSATGTGTINIRPGGAAVTTGAITVTTTALGFFGATAAVRQAYVVPTGTISRATFVTSTVTLPVLAGVVMALITDLKSFGLLS